MVFFFPHSSAGVPVQGLSPPGGGCQFGPGSGARHSRCQSAGAYGPPGFHRGDAERRCGRSCQLTQYRINFHRRQEQNRNKLSHPARRCFCLAASLCPAKATSTTTGFTRNTRRGGRVVDRVALEMRSTRKGTGGSNPSLSASFLHPIPPERRCGAVNAAAVFVHGRVRDRRPGHAMFRQRVERAVGSTLRHQQFSGRDGE
jgi:hypothetical protein